jgi:hypothetical protein
MSVEQGIFRCQAPDFDAFTFEERRDRLGPHTSGFEREADFVLQIVVPAQGLLLRSISVHNRFVVDPILSHLVSSGFGHR